MNKTLLFEKLKQEVDQQLKLAIASAQNTLDAATNEESKAENKYDTRGLEASYLARAQTERVLDLKALRSGLDSLKIRSFTDEQPIAITALIRLETNEKLIWALLLPKGGGQSFAYEDLTIKVITPESPLGANLIGKNIDDVIRLGEIEYSILEVF